jgi:DNA polymerase-3 subunit delta
MKVAASGVAAFLRKPPAELAAALIYGPDAGLVRERADDLLLTVVDDPADPFRVAELSATVLREDPARLRDEADALALTGGRRVVRVREAADGLTDLFASFLADGGGDALVIAEAGTLAGRSRLRNLFEGASDAAALPCYGDEGGGLEAVIRETLGARGVTADAEATAFLCDNLGIDRLLSRAELEKLALYVGDGETASLADAVACVGDSAVMTLEDIAFAAGGGKHGDLVRKLARAYQEGATPVGVLRVAARHFQRLHFAVGRIAGGEAADGVLRSLRPPVFFKRADDFRAQLHAWSSPRLAAALDVLTEAEIQCKSTGLPAQEVCGQALLRIASAAQRARGG